MARTDNLRSLVRTKLKTITELEEVYYEIADTEALFPHAVITFDSVDLGDINRHDYVVNVDVYDRGPSASQVEGICDKIENIFCNLNAPTDAVLPTFYLESRQSIADEDKAIRRRLVRLQAQNYDKE